MTREEAMEIVKLYDKWNTGQKSMSLAFGGARTPEDDVYDAQRKTIIRAHEVLQSNEGDES